MFIFVDTQQADYHVIASLTYRANGAVSQSCLPMYQDNMAQHYTDINDVLTKRCSGLSVNMNVSFIKSMPSLIDENLLKVRNKLYEILIITNIEMTVIMRQQYDEE